VNSIFNPEYVDTLYPKSARYRRNLLADARATNYSVVRLELIERLYERMYEQRREFGTDETKWPHRIMGGRYVVRTNDTDNGIQLHVQRADSEVPNVEEVFAKEVNSDTETEILDVDLIISATGYRRTAHVDMLRDLWPLLPETSVASTGVHTHPDGWEVRTKTMDAAGETRVSTRKLEVARDYAVRFSPGSVASGSGIWLQGCCEGTHGVSHDQLHGPAVAMLLIAFIQLSDTLLSVLATRSGEIVESIFGGRD